MTDDTDTRFPLVVRCWPRSGTIGTMLHRLKTPTSRMSFCGHEWTWLRPNEVRHPPTARCDTCERVLLRRLRLTRRNPDAAPR